MELKTQIILDFLATLDKDKTLNLNSERSSPEVLCANKLTKKEYEMADFENFEAKTRDGDKAKYTKVEKSYAAYCRKQSRAQNHKKKVSEIIKEIKKI